MKGTEKKKEIRYKALALFKEKGFDAVTVIDIAKAANISKNTFYYYFDSKDDIILEQFDSSKMNIEELRQEVDVYSTYQEKVVFLFSSLASYYEEMGVEVVKRALYLNVIQKMINTRTGTARHPFYYYLEELCKETGQKEMASTLQTLFTGCVYIWATASTYRSLRNMVVPKVEMVIQGQK